MVIVEIMGGLGNQMFQYAFKMAYDAAHSQSALINVNTFNTYKSQPYLLDYFNIDKCYATPQQVANCQKKYRKLRWKFPFRFYHKTFVTTVTETIENIYDPQLINKTGDVYYTGYFQTEKYFKHIRDDILHAFSLRIPLNTENKRMLKKIKSTKTSVSVHIRRGDYTKLQHIYGATDIKYYKKAMQYISENVSNPHFFIFSNDIKWCKKHFSSNKNITFVDINDGNTGYFDLELMRNCKHNIIANSTFSWWGAWLNENPDKIVIAPGKWFADNRPTDIIPENWIKI